MKKMFFYAAIAAVAFASCSKDKGIELPNNGVEEETTMEAIQFAMGNTIEVTTRGTGGVGDVVDSLNVWKGQKLNVYMFDKGTMKISVNPTDGLPYFVNAVVTAPNDTASSPANYGAAKYYASNKTYDFFAYHGDDAVTVAPAPNKDTTAYAVNFEIDGTQDLMVAKAKMSDKELAAANDTLKARAYSAYAARRGVHPRFAFQHELSRFVFNVTASKTDSTALGLVIDSVRVVDAPIAGRMVVAAINEDSLGVTFAAATDTLVLMDRANAGAATSALQPVELDSLGEKVRLGESMLLAPGLTKYNVQVFYSQMGKDGQKLKDVYEASVALKNNAVFEAGAQYDVNITVYGFQKIELICDLTKWVDGEDVELDSEQ